jgi:hypothetical protein
VLPQLPTCVKGAEGDYRRIAPRDAAGGAIPHRTSHERTQWGWGASGLVAYLREEFGAAGSRLEAATAGQAADVTRSTASFPGSGTGDWQPSCRRSLPISGYTRLGRFSIRLSVAAAPDAAVAAPCQQQKKSTPAWAKECVGLVAADGPAVLAAAGIRQIACLLWRPAVVDRARSSATSALHTFGRLAPRV